MSTQNNPTQRLRGIYLLPNLLTTCGLFAGFYAIVSAMKGHFDTAAIAIFIAMIADALDGRVARLTNTESAFGIQYDSLSDLVSFGVAPALVIYRYALMDLKSFGWLVAFIFTAAGALRLARFNTQVKTQDKRYFQGLAIPAGAGIIAAIVWNGPDVVEKWLALLLAIVTLIVAVLMVSKIRYYSFKDIDLKGKIRFFTLVSVVLILVLISIDPPLVLLILFVGYGVSGALLTLMHLRKTRQDRRVRQNKQLDK